MDHSSTNRDFEYPKQSVHNHYLYNGPFDSVTYSYNNSGCTLSSLNDFSCYTDYSVIKNYDFGYPYDAVYNPFPYKRLYDSALLPNMYIDGRFNPLPSKNASNYPPPDSSSIEGQYFYGTGILKFLDHANRQPDLCRYYNNDADVVYESSMMHGFQRFGGQIEIGGRPNEYDYHFPPLTLQSMLADCRYKADYAENGQQLPKIDDKTQTEQPRSATPYMTSARMKQQQIGSATSNFD